MHPLDLQVLGLLALVKILNAAVGQFEGVAQVRARLLPGLGQLLRSHLQWFGSEAIEAFGELDQRLVAVLFDLGQDLLNRAHSLLLGLSRGATGKAIQCLFRRCDVMKTTQQRGHGGLAARRCHRRGSDISALKLGPVRSWPW